MNMQQFGDTPDDMLYRCPKCDEDGLNAADLRAHYSAVHLRYFPYGCHHCPVWFVSTIVLSYHCSREHPGKEQRMNSNQKRSAEAELDSLQSIIDAYREDPTSSSNGQLELPGSPCENNTSDIQHYQPQGTMTDEVFEFAEDRAILDCLKQESGDCDNGMIKSPPSISADSFNNTTDVETQLLWKPKLEHEVNLSISDAKGMKNENELKQPSKSSDQRRWAHHKVSRVTDGNNLQVPEEKQVVIDESSETNIGLQDVPLPPGMTTVTAVAAGGVFRIVRVDQTQPFSHSLEDLGDFVLIASQPTFEQKLRSALWSCAKAACRNVERPWKFQAQLTKLLPPYAKQATDYCVVQPEPFRTWLFQFCAKYHHLYKDHREFRDVLRKVVPRVTKQNTDNIRTLINTDSKRRRKK